MHSLAHNLANFVQTLALREAVAQRYLTSLQEKPIKIGFKAVRHARYAVFQMAEIAVPRELLKQILQLTTDSNDDRRKRGSEWAKCAITTEE